MSVANNSESDRSSLKQSSELFYPPRDPDPESGSRVRICHKAKSIIILIRCDRTRRRVPHRESRNQLSHPAETRILNPGPGSRFASNNRNYSRS
jgi:hypothetical protein